MKTKRITFRLTETEEEAVRNYCSICGLSQADLIRSLIRLFLLTRRA